MSLDDSLMRNTTMVKLNHGLVSVTGNTKNNCDGLGSTEISGRKLGVLGCEPVMDVTTCSNV